MKTQILAISALCFCSFFAEAQNGICMAGSGFFTLPIAATTITTTKTTETTTTTTDGVLPPPPAPAVPTVLPADGKYTYAEYKGVWVPYYKGYYYIDGVWVWLGHGRAPFPPPKFRPVLRNRTCQTGFGKTCPQTHVCETYSAPRSSCACAQSAAPLTR